MDNGPSLVDYKSELKIIGGMISRNGPIIEVGLTALEGQFVFEETGEPYVGLYHKHQDGTLMIGKGNLGTIHKVIPSEVIIPIDGIF